MNKLLAALVALMFSFGTVSVFAADDAAKTGDAPKAEAKAKAKAPKAKAPKAKSKSKAKAEAKADATTK